MGKIIVKSLSLLLFASFFTVITTSFAGGPPSLYGKLLLQGVSGTSPFGGADVILAAVKAPDNTFKAHTDQNGLYAFYDVPPGEYKLHVEIGGSVMPQISSGQESETSTVEVTKQPMNNNSITVKQKN